VTISSARNAAFKVLYRVQEVGGYANLSLEEALRRQPLKPEDRRLATELVNGTVRYDLRLQYVLGKYLTKGSKGLPASLLIVLKLALYQIMFLERIPDYAVINEAVEQTAALGLTRLKGLTNAVLREAVRQQGIVDYPNREQELAHFLSIYYSHPLWLVERWLTNWGLDYTERLLAFNNTSPPVTLRVNNLKVSREQLQNELDEQGVMTSLDTHTPWALRFNQGGLLTATPASEAGHFYIQHKSTMLAAAALQPEPNQTVIDACAGVGGKSTMLAQLMLDQGQITALELYSSKLKLLEANCNRLGITSIKTCSGDLLAYNGEPVPLVLLDAPCSGLGVLRRRSDARFRRQEQDIIELSALQAKLLDHCSTLVQPGGTLVYSTCTMEAEENEQVVEAFLAQHREFEPLGYPECWQQLAITGIRAKGAGWLLDPTVLNIDGMFVARMRRKN